MSLEPLSWKSSIQALPKTTVRQIGCSQVLVDPSSVVKELIDNALDARATSIAVEIAANTIDVIQVRDNGHSITPQDRALICRKHCTSKIRAFDDLRSVGGASLGFRGEALASLAEMSGSLGIAVRVEGEGVATLLKIGRDGEIEAQERASHPVGTTVRATDFFQRWPVRKQAALKHSARYHARIKRIMQAYALARPAVRFALKVVKAKNDKGAWVYAPKPGAKAIEDAAFKVAGKDCASQCAYSVLSSNGYEIEAFLPRPDAEASKISGIGQFVSIDSRPVSTSRGTLKQISTLFKGRLKISSPQLDGVKDPFLRMDIGCPHDSYDPNVEPAKDDVLFDDSSVVLRAVEEFFAAFYPELSADDLAENPGSQSTGSIEELSEDDRPTITQPPEIQVYEDREDGVGPVSEQAFRAARTASSQPSFIREQENQNEGAGCTPRQKRRRTWKYNMYDVDEEDLPLIDSEHPRLEEIEDTQQLRNDVTLSNPWTMAKMNASTRGKGPTRNTTQLSTPLKERTNAQLNVASSTPQSSTPQHPEQHPLTPQTSSPIRIGNANGDRELLGRNVERLPGHHDTPVRHHSPFQVQTRAHLPAVQDFPRQFNNDFVSARAMEYGTPLEAIPEAPRRPRRTGLRSQQPSRVNKPFKSPVNPDADNWFSSVPSQRVTRAQRRSQQSARADEQDQRVRREMIMGPAEAAAARLVRERDRDIRDFVGGNDTQSPMVTPFRSPIVDDTPQASRAVDLCPGATNLLHGRPSADAQASRIRQFRSDIESGFSADEEVGQQSTEDMHPLLHSRPATASSTRIPSEFLEAEAPIDGRNERVRRRKSQPRPRADSSTGEVHLTEQEQPDNPRPRRRRTTGEAASCPQRTRSSRLPLERVPENAQVHNVSLKLSPSVPDIARGLRRLDAQTNSPDWRLTADEVYDAFSEAALPGVVLALAGRLSLLLTKLHPSLEPRPDLNDVIREALLRPVDEMGLTVA